MCVFMHMNAGPGEGQKTVSESLELRLQAVSLTWCWVISSEPDSGVGSVLNGWAISPAFEIYFLQIKFITAPIHT